MSRFPFLRAISLGAIAVLGSICGSMLQAQVVVGTIGTGPVPTGSLQPNQVHVAGAENFRVLSYDQFNPFAAQIIINEQDPDRYLVETRVDNDRDFFNELNKLPDSVALMTDEKFLLAHDKAFFNLTVNYEMTIIAAITGSVDQLEAFAVDGLGISEMAERFVGPGTTGARLIVQYILDLKIAYLIGDEYFSKSKRHEANYFEPPIKMMVPFSEEDKAAVGPAFWYHLVRLVHAALEEPFWNRMHYLSGHTLGCLGLDWDTALSILYYWEVFEAKIGIGELGKASGIYGVIWDLIWGMVGYVDGSNGWLPD